MKFEDELRARLEEDERVSELNRRQAMLDEYLIPASQPPTGTVVLFYRNFDTSDTLYEYAALRCSNGLWHVTGAKSPQGVTWRALALWLVAGDQPVALSDLIRMEPESDDEHL